MDLASARYKAFLLRAYLPCAVLAVGLAVVFVRSEDSFYFWDWGIYWAGYRYMGGLASRSLWDLMRYTLKTVSEDDYNVSGLLPLMPVYAIFGGGRIPYVAAICALYVVPAALIAACLATRSKVAAAPAWLAVTSALLMPVFWNAALRGMIDPVGLIPLGLAAVLLLNSRFLTQGTWKEAALIGFMLWLPFLLRRWYAYSVIVLISLSLIGTAIIEWREARPRSAALKSLLRWVSAGAVVILALSAYQMPLVLRILGTDYAHIYSAYQSTRWQQAEAYYMNFGPVIGAFLILGITVDLRQRCWENLFFLAVAAIIAGWFAAQQFAPGVQHYLPIAMMMFPSLFSGISFAWRRLGPVWGLSVPAMLALNLANTYVLPSNGMLQEIRSVLGGPSYPPLRLAQVPEYRRLARDLLDLGTDKRIAIFASSPNLSGWLMWAVEEKLGNRLMPVSDVDLRDHFNWRVLDAEYAIITRPVQLHLQPEGQRVISIPVEEIETGNGIGRSFIATGRTYALANGVVAEVYRRIQPIPAQDLAAFKERFYKIYPQWRLDEQADNSKNPGRPVDGEAD